jgi:hypothetical protein
MRGRAAFATTFSVDDCATGDCSLSSSLFSADDIARLRFGATISTRWMNCSYFVLVYFLMFLDRYFECLPKTDASLTNAVRCLCVDVYVRRVHGASDPHLVGRLCAS